MKLCGRPSSSHVHDAKKKKEKREEEKKCHAYRYRVSDTSPRYLYPTPFYRFTDPVASASREIRPVPHIYIYIYSTIIQHLCRFCWSACFLNSVHVRAIVTRGKLCCTTLFQSESKNTHCETGRKEDLLREAKSTSAVRNKNRDTGDASARPMQPSPIRNR